MNANVTKQDREFARAALQVHSKESYEKGVPYTSERAQTVEAMLGDAFTCSFDGDTCYLRTGPGFDATSSLEQLITLNTTVGNIGTELGSASDVMKTTGSGSGSD